MEDLTGRAVKVADDIRGRRGAGSLPAGRALLHRRHCPIPIGLPARPCSIASRMRLASPMLGVCLVFVKQEIEKNLRPPFPPGRKCRPLRAFQRHGLPPGDREKHPSP